ncbi:MAG: ABC transporter substrate-binding protein, partial [Mycobacterium sp.]
MRITTIIAIAATAVVGLSGCAVDHSKPDASKPTVRIAYQTFPSGDLIVKNNKWLEEELPDYNIKWTKFDSGADVNTAFIAKQVDFGALGSSPVARGLSAPLNIPYQVAFILDVAGDNEALVARNGSGIESIANLKGKRVATPFASTAHYSLLAALAQNGLSANDVQLVDLQPQAILAAWDRGDIAAAYSWLPTLDQLEKTGKVLITSRELADKGKPTLDLAAVSSSFAKENPKVVDVWRRQQARALTELKNDPAAAAKAIAAEVALSPADVEQQLKKTVFLTPDQMASPEWLGTDGKPGNLAANLESASQFLAEQKQIPAPTPLAVFQNALY